jgi:glycosyltransferase involved in cell wall biosynthesis
LRIGLVTGEYPPMQGGVGDFTYELGGALAALGHDVHVSVWRRSWSSLYVLPMLARELELDVVNIQYQAAAYGLTAPVHFLPRVVGVPSVVTFHDLRVPYLFPKAGPLRWRAVLGLARGATAVIVTNSEDESRLREAGGVRCLAQIPIGSNIAPSLPPGYERDEWRLRLGVEPQTFLLGYFGFLNASKGGDTLVRALALLRQQGRAVRLLLIGGRTGTSDPTNAGYGDQVDALAQELGLGDLIQWTGFVSPEEVSGHLAACDAVVLPYLDGASFRRGSLMAALAHGCPIVSTTPASPQPGLVAGENICLFPPGDAAGCAAATARLMDLPELRRRLAEGAKMLAAEFTWDRIAGRTAEVFQALI